MVTITFMALSSVSSLFCAPVLPNSLAERSTQVRIAVYDNTLYPGAPAYITVSETGAGEASGQPPKRLEGVLHRDSTTVCTFPVFECLRGTGHSGVIYTGFLIHFDKEAREQKWFATPGVYSLRIRDSANPEYRSDDVAVTVAEPKDRALAAWNELSAKTPREIVSAVVDRQASQATLEVFRKVAQDQQGTPYAQMATAVVSLVESRAAETEDGGDQAARRILGTLTEAADHLPRAYPLRQKILYRRATLEAKCDQVNAAKATIREIREAFPDHIPPELSQLEAEIIKLQRR